MPALDFPANPTTGQQSNGFTYDGTKWKATTTSVAPSTVSATPPPSPTVGDMWFNTNDGTLYFYYNDGNTSQWVESRAPITANGYYSPNYLINGGMDIWQRGTTVNSNGGFSNAFAADRWSFTYASGVANQGTLSRFASDLTGFRFATRIQRNSGATSVTALNMAQYVETISAVALAGKTVTLSFYARKGAGYSAANSYLNPYIITGTGVDQNAVLTGYTNQYNQNTSVTLTSSWARYSYTVTVPSNATELCVIFNFTPTGTSGANDYYDITGIQLEEGTVATAFRRNGNSIQEELASCKRFYQQKENVYANCTNGGFTNSYAGVQLYEVEMHHTPTVSVWPGANFTGTSGQGAWYPGGTNATLSSEYATQKLYQVMFIGNSSYNLVVFSYKADAEI